ncbi:MAG: 4-hydroxy-tetrahydrodipicolinate synthase [Burkholderiales bacterium]
MLKGSIVAIVTPMLHDGALDYPRLKSLIDFHVANGTDAIGIVGTTGESPTVTPEEHCDLIAAAVKYADKRIPVVAGTGANSTREAIELARFAKQAGADFSLTVVPYYNKPSQEGLYQHFRTIAEAVDMPHILYNVPGRTVADMHNDTVLRLAQISNIVGIKDATGDITRGSDLLRRKPKHFAVYSGDDGTQLALILLGAAGSISVTANVAPKLMHDMIAAALARDIDNALIINNKLLPLHQKLFIEANPIPVKWALQQMGLIESGIRLPLVELGTAYHAAVREAMQHAGIA